MSGLEIVIGIAILTVVVGGFAFVSSRLANRREPIEPSFEQISDGETGGETATATKPRPDGALLDAAEDIDTPVETPPAAPPKLRDRLGKARGSISEALRAIGLRGGIDPATWEELEEALIKADVGVGPAMDIVETVRGQAKEGDVTDIEGLIDLLKAECTQRLLAPIDLLKSTDGPSIYLFVGVNGVGKTTTIGKVGKSLSDHGASVVMAAGDTFRAAAAEQLQTWAERSGSTLIRGEEGSDPSSVIFDAVAHAASVDADYVLADTAGRLHNKSNLMAELEKVRRVADKGEGEVVEVLLVIDATTGQNGLTQARVFAESCDVTGVVLTKLDGSSKGGIVLAIQSELDLPVKLVGLGEGAADLIPFDAEQFSDGLFSLDD